MPKPPASAQSSRRCSEPRVADFVPGLELARRFYGEAVRPILEDAFSELPHSAALLGPGSEVLGYDDAMSTDHHWGPRAMLFVSGPDYKARAESLRQTLAERLPTSFLGYSTNFTEPQKDGAMMLRQVESGPVNHRVEIMTVKGFFRAILGVDPLASISTAEWLTFPQQSLRSIAAGAVFHDDLGLEDARAVFRWYPEDVWLYLLASGWRRIAQQEAFVGRTGLEGDELGSRLIATNLVRDLMRLCFLIERSHVPYAKWFGRAFGELSCAEVLVPVLERATSAAGWKERENALVAAYSQVACMHNDLGITDPLPTEATPYYDRPFLVLHADRFADALHGAIQDPQVRQLAERPLIGSLDQLSDSTDVAHPRWRTRLRALYGKDE